MAIGKPPRPYGLGATALPTAPSPSSRGTRACRGAPGTDAFSAPPRLPSRRSGQRARRAADSRGTGELGGSARNGSGPRGPMSPARGYPSEQGAPPPSAPRPRPTSAFSRVGRRWRIPAEDTYLRGYIVSPLCYDSTSRAQGWDLSAHHPGAVAPLFSLPLYSAVGRNPTPVCPIRGHFIRD